MDPAAQELITRHNEQMRELIVRDIDALENKLDVKRQVARKADEAMDKVKGTLGMNQTNRSEGWAGFVRHNAAPLLAVGLGGTVLAKNLKDRAAATGTQSTTTRMVTDSSYVPYPGSTQIDGSSDGGGLKDRVDDMKSTASDGVDTAREKVSEVTGTAKEKVSGVADAAKAKVSGAKGSVSDARGTVATQAVHAKDVVVEHIPSREEAGRMAADHNQLLGLAALAAGALAGTFVPRTQAEKEKLAPVQAHVKERATELVEEGVDKAKETAERATEAVNAAKEAAKDEFQDGGDDDTGSDLADVTTPNRITSSRNGVATGANSGGAGTTY